MSIIPPDVTSKSEMAAIPHAVFLKPFNTGDKFAFIKNGEKFALMDSAMFPVFIVYLYGQFMFGFSRN